MSECTHGKADSEDCEKCQHLAEERANTAAESADYRKDHPWYTPSVEAAHKILLNAADKLDTTERRLAHGEKAQALCNLIALRIEINTAIQLLTGECGHVKETPPELKRILE